MRVHAPWLAGIIFFAIVVSAIPGIVAYSHVSDWSSGDIVELLAHHTYGTSYYDARLHEIGDGYPFIGNPYFIEHRDASAPAFFVADWLAALPMFFGISLEWTLILNALFWPAVLTVIAYFILHELGAPPRMCGAGALLTFSQGYFLVITPVSMQTVFPFFLLLLLAFIIWFKRLSWHAGVLLAIASALTLYVYTYLELIAAAFLSLAGALLFYTRDFARVRALLVVGIGVALLAVPALFYTLSQLHDPNYWETMARIGLAYTRIPTSEGFLTAFLALCGVLLWLVSYAMPEFRARESARVSTYTFALSGIALVAVTFSNILTGKELELSGHVSRFTAVWLPLSLTAWAVTCWPARELFHRLTVRSTLIFVLAAFNVFGIAYDTRHWLVFFQSRDDSPAAYQTFHEALPALRFLDEVHEPSVVLADPDDPLNELVPALTKHYVVFGGGGVFHLAPSEEVTERYLASNLFDPLTKDELQAHVLEYAGIGNAVHQYQAHNRAVKLCVLLQLPRLNVSCGSLTTAEAWLGANYYDALWKSYQDMREHRGGMLATFHVTYVVRNKTLEPDPKPFSISLLRLVYDDQVYAVYEVRESR